MTLSTHVLDTSIGRPAADVAVTVYRRDGTDWTPVGSGFTDGDGRIQALLERDAQPAAGEFRIVFDVARYFSARRVESFYGQVTVEFNVRDAAAHYHVPLLVSPYGYSTYRGS
jgi:5-hydroxyisourate hydrolase